LLIIGLLSQKEKSWRIDLDQACSLLERIMCASLIFHICIFVLLSSQEVEASLDTLPSSNEDIPSLTGNPAGDLALLIIGVTGAGGGIVIFAFETIRDHFTKMRDTRLAAAETRRQELNNKLIKEREEYIELSKEKIRIISELVPWYVDMASYYGSLSSQFGVALEKAKKENSTVVSIDTERCLFYIARIFYLEEKISAKGNFQFCDTKAEKLVATLNYELTLCMFGLEEYESNESHLAYKDKSVLSSVVYDNNTKEALPYYKFFDTLNNHSEGSRFKGWLNGLTPLQFERLRKHSKWTKDLIIFELNHIYEVFYNQKPNPKEYLDEEFLKEIGGKEEYSAYSERLKRLEEEALKKSQT
jgi:hypothetical protein